MIQTWEICTGSVSMVSAKLNNLEERYDISIEGVTTTDMMLIVVCKLTLKVPLPFEHQMTEVQKAAERQRNKYCTRCNHSPCECGDEY